MTFNNKQAKRSPKRLQIHLKTTTLERMFQPRGNLYKSSEHHINTWYDHVWILLIDKGFHDTKTSHSSILYFFSWSYNLFKNVIFLYWVVTWLRSSCWLRNSSIIHLTECNANHSTCRTVSQLQKSSWPVWLPGELYTTN